MNTVTRCLLQLSQASPQSRAALILTPSCPQDSIASPCFLPTFLAYTLPGRVCLLLSSRCSELTLAAGKTPLCVCHSYTPKTNCPPGAQASLQERIPVYFHSRQKPILPSRHSQHAVDCGTCLHSLRKEDHMEKCLALRRGFLPHIPEMPVTVCGFPSTVAAPAIPAKNSFLWEPAILNTVPVCSFKYPNPQVSKMFGISLGLC